MLSGFSYKLKWPETDHAIYITINDIVEDGRRRPFEIFINSKNMEHYAWTVALTRMISAVFRRGGDVSFVVEELKAVFDPRGGQWMGGRYVPSLLAAIGGVIERHMIETGFLEHGAGASASPSWRRTGSAASPARAAAGSRSCSRRDAPPACPAASPNAAEARLTSQSICSIFVLMMHGHPLSATLPEDSGLGERFWYWRGASGQRYIHSIYRARSLPARCRRGVRHLVRCGWRRGGRWPSAASTPRACHGEHRVAGGRAGEEEIHVHLLARDEDGARRVLRDLLAAMDAAPRRAAEPRPYAKPVQLELLAA